MASVAWGRGRGKGEDRERGAEKCVVQNARYAVARERDGEGEKERVQRVNYA